MIDPIQVPLLLKAIDFVFDEGRKILDERRKRRETSDDHQIANDGQESVKEVILPDLEKKNEIKQGLLESKVDELLWQNHELEIKHLVRLLETYSRNYHLAKEQYAKWGSALVPPIIINNMTDAENSMIESMEKLQNILSKIYKKDIYSTE